MGSHKNGAKTKIKTIQKDREFTTGEDTNGRYAAFDSTMEQVGTEQRKLKTKKTKTGWWDDPNLASK